MIYIIIVTYNAEQFIEKTIYSILHSQPKHNFKILAVDNASRDKTVEKLEKFPHISIIRNDKNLGFGRAVNQGLKKFLKSNAEYVLLLNQDAELFPDTIDKLIEFYETFENKEEIGILAPLEINNEGNPQKLVFHWLMRSNFQFFVDLYNNNLQNVYFTNFISASCWLLPRKTVETIGGFNPMFFMYGEDGEYCFRVKAHKLKIALLPKVFYKHHKINFYKKSFSRQILEVRNYFVEHSAEPNYTFAQNVKSSLRFIYTETIKFLALFRFKLAFAYIIGTFWFFVSLPKAYHYHKLEQKPQPTFLTDE